MISVEEKFGYYFNIRMTELLQNIKGIDDMPIDDINNNKSYIKNYKEISNELKEYYITEMNVRIADIIIKLA
jgi:hypothetical protein